MFALFDKLQSSFLILVTHQKLECMKNLFTTSLFLLVLVPNPTIQAQSPSPKRAAETFYRTYLNLKVRGLPNESQMKVLSPLITAELQDLFIKATEVQVKYKQENPDDKPP